DHETRPDMPVPELVLEVKEVVLVAIEEHHLLGLEGERLAHQFAPDRSGRTRDQHAAPAQAVAHLRLVEPHHLPPEEILDIDRPDLAETRLAPLDLAARG